MAFASMTAASPNFVLLEKPSNHSPFTSLRIPPNPALFVKYLTLPSTLMVNWWLIEAFQQSLKILSMTEILFMFSSRMNAQQIFPQNVNGEWLEGFSSKTELGDAAVIEAKVIVTTANLLF
nr:hypothetical protein Iba_chr08fCG0720 [Ipomoea batatas]